MVNLPSLAATTQKLRLGLEQLSNLEFDGSSRIFECPIGYSQNCVGEQHTCSYYGPKDNNLGNCSVPFICAFLKTVPKNNSEFDNADS